MFRYDSQQTGRSPYIGPDTPILKGSFWTGGEIHGSPAVGQDGTIYATSADGHLYVIACDGRGMWQFDAGREIYSSPALGPDGTIYLNAGKLYALSPEGKVKWTYDTDVDLHTSSPTVGPDGTIYVSAANKLLALNPDGDLRWKGDLVGGVGWSSPAVATDGTAYVGCWDHNLYAFSSDGSLKWTYATGDMVNSTPAISPDGTVYFGSFDGKLYACSPEGALKWELDLQDSNFQLALAADGTLYANVYGGMIVHSSDNVETHAGTLYAIDPNGVVKWTLEVCGGPHPAIDANGTIYVTSHDNQLWAVNTDGSLKWTFALPTEEFERVDSPVSIGAGGLIYIGSDLLKHRTSLGVNLGPSKAGRIFAIGDLYCR